MSRTYRHASDWMIARYEQREIEYVEDLKISNYRHPTCNRWERWIKERPGRRPVRRDGALCGWGCWCCDGPPEKRRYERRQERHRRNEEIRKGNYDDL